MRRIGVVMLFLSACFLAARPAAAQKEKEKPKAVAAKEVTADALGKEAAALGFPAMDEKYKGKTLRVRGKIGSMNENNVYLPSKSKYKDGGQVVVGMVFPEKSPPKGLAEGQVVVIEGVYERTDFLGPSFHDCVIVPK